MTPKQRQALSAILGTVGESLAAGMTPADAALLIDADDLRRLDAATRAAIENARSSPALASELPLALARAAGPRSEAWVRMLPETARQGEALSVLAEELWRPRRVSAVFILIVADLIVLGVVGLVFAIFIAPTWNELLEGLGAVLPMPTRLSIWLGQAITILVALGLVAAIVFRVSARVRPSGAFTDALDRVVRRLPVMRRYLRLRQSVGLAQWLAIGPEPLPLVRAMAEAGRPLSLGPVGRELQRRLEANVKLSQALGESDAFEPGLAEIVRRLEEKGYASSQHLLLTRYAAVNEGREGPALDRLVLAMHFATAILIGIFVIGLYMPIFKLGSVI